MYSDAGEIHSHCNHDPCCADVVGGASLLATLCSARFVRVTACAPAASRFDAQTRAHRWPPMQTVFCCRSGRGRRSGRTAGHQRFAAAGAASRRADAAQVSTHPAGCDQTRARRSMSKRSLLASRRASSQLRVEAKARSLLVGRRSLSPLRGTAKARPPAARAFRAWHTTLTWRGPADGHGQRGGRPQQPRRPCRPPQRLVQGRWSAQGQSLHSPTASHRWS